MSGQLSPLKSATDALNVQSCVPSMPVADARSVMVTGTAVVAGGVGGGGFGAGPAPGIADTAGTGSSFPGASESGPDGQLACSTTALEPSRPTRVMLEPAGSVARPMISVSAAGALAEATGAQAVPSKTVPAAQTLSGASAVTLRSIPAPGIGDLLQVLPSQCSASGRLTPPSE